MNQKGELQGPRGYYCNNLVKFGLLCIQRKKGNVMEIGEQLPGVQNGNVLLHKRDM